MVRPKKKSAKKSESTPSTSSKSPKSTSETTEKISATEFEEDKGSVFDRVFNEMDEYAVMLLDDSGNILTWNKGAERIKGYSAKEILGKNYRIFYSEEDRAKRLSEQVMSEARRMGKANYEGWRVRKDGTRFWGSMSLIPIQDSGHHLARFLKITRDLTDKKLAEDRDSNILEELKLKNEELRLSEERYHKMIEEVVDYAIILLDRNGKVLDWNRGAEKLKGYKAGEIIGRSFKLFYPKEEKDTGVPEKLLALAAKEGTATHEGWRVRKDGNSFWGNVTITALHGEHGEVIGFTKVTRDLTERKIADDRISNTLEELRQTNEQLRQSEERYHKMIEEVQDYAIILLDERGTILNWNRGAQVIKGYTASEVVGKSFSIFYPLEDRKRKLPETLLAKARAEGKVTHEGWRVRKDGSQIWGSVVITALHNGDGKILGFSKVTRDLTERKIAEDALKKSAAQLDLKNKTLERLNDELSSFTHVASHDMKEPLRKILTFASKLESDHADREHNLELITKIKSSASRMQALIDDLLSFSQVSNDSASFERVDLNKIVQNVKNDLEVAIQEKNAALHVDRLPVIDGVSFQWQQLFLNLISNSLKFSRNDEHPVIEIKCNVIKGPDLPDHTFTSSNRYYHIEVSDNGIGFEPEQRDLIFEAFQRLHNRTQYSGTGLGLAIVKKVVEKHHGIITAQGDPGVGAVFHIYLPVTEK